MRDRISRRTWAALAVAVITTLPVAHEVAAAPGASARVRTRAQDVGRANGNAAPKTADAIAPRRATEVAPTKVEPTSLGSTRAREPVGKRAVARALGTTVLRRDTKIELSPRRPADGGAVMNFHSAIEVSAERGRALFVEPITGWGGNAEVGIPVREGHKYLLECGVTPGDATWELSWQTGTRRHAATTVGSEHPAFVFTAGSGGSMRLYLEATNVQRYEIHACTITSVAT